MKILLDTCVFLWFISRDKCLPSSMLRLMTAEENEIFLSPVSLWECLLKAQTGRLKLPRPPQVYVPEQREKHGILSLALDELSVSHLSKLPSLHKDPFDRILVCQATEHSLSLVTPDEAIQQYPVKTIWE